MRQSKCEATTKAIAGLTTLHEKLSGGKAPKLSPLWKAELNEKEGETAEM